MEEPAWWRIIVARVFRKGQMPRYFFNVRNHVHTEDFDGRELADFEMATQEAKKDIADIMRPDSKC